MPRTASIVALAVAAAISGTTPFIARADAASAPERYVRSAQNADGGFGMTVGSASSNQLASGWAALGLAAAGRNPLDVRVRGRHVVDYLRRTSRSIDAIGDIERTVLVLRAAGAEPRRFAGRNLLREILRRQRRNGSISGYVSYTSFGLLALRAARVSASQRSMRSALRWLERQQNADGGFAVSGRGASSTVDDTGYAIQAIVATAGHRRSSVRRAAAFLVRSQRADGGFAISRGAASNAQSTAYAVQGLVAARRGASAERRGRRYLRSLTERNGLVRYSRTSRITPVWVSAQALLALERRPFPLRPVRR